MVAGLKKKRPLSWMPVANVPKKSLQVVSIEEFKNERLAEAVIFETFKNASAGEEPELSFLFLPSGIIESGDVLLESSSIKNKSIVFQSISRERLSLVQPLLSHNQ